MIWRLIAVALFGIASIAGPVAAAGSAVLATALLWFSFSRPDLNPDASLTPVSAAGLAIVLVLVGSKLGSFGYPEPAGLVSGLWIGAAVTAAVLVAWPRARIRSVGPMLAGGLIVVLAVGTVLQFHGNLFGLDVYRSHEAAADALAAGENPYTDAVRVLDGSPNAEEGAVIEGYSYPPVTLVGFSLGDWLGGDPRWATALAIVGGLALAVRGSGVKTLGPLVLVILAATPTLRWIVWSGATEPLTFALLIAAVSLWRRPVAVGLLLGLALATKQYLVILVPLLLFMDERPWKRSWIAVGVAGSTLLPALLADPQAFWHTLVERPLSLGFRPDTQSISGALDRLGWRVEVPTALMLLAVVAVTWAFARSVPAARPSVLLGGSAVVLSVTFLLSLAFTNYWWLVQWLAAGATVLGAGERSAQGAGDELSPGVAA